LKRTLVLAALAVAASSGCGSDTFVPLRGWKTDLEEARQLSAQAGKPLAVLYSAPWSGQARNFEEETLSDAAVAAELKRFVLVHLNLDEHKDNPHQVRWVPTMVLESPLGEKKVLDQGCYPPEFLAGELAGLGDWRQLDGWESVPAAAEERARASGRPLAVLYSAAWNRDAIEYEDGPLAQALPVLNAKFTLLRLNFESNRSRAEADGVAAGDVPALVLPTAKGGKVVVPGRHPAALLTGFIDEMNAYRPEIPGWSPRESDLKEVRSGRKKGPMVVLLDKPTHWQSYHFVHQVLGAGEVGEWLKGFGRVRLEYRPDLPLAGEFGIREVDVPCVLIFNSFGDYHEKKSFAAGASAIANELRAVGGRIPTGAPAPEQ
jgi:hypothetical protein